MTRGPRKKRSSPDEEKSGWETLTEEASGGALPANDELEQALREAAEAVDARRAEKRDEGDPADPGDEPGEAAAGDGQGAPGEAQEAAEGQGELQERMLRLQADFENFRRRTLKDREEAYNFGHQNLVKELLPTVDNLDRAIEHARQSEGTDLESLLQGVELVRRELLGVLAKYGVSEIEAQGKPFDPAVHEAMAQAPDASVPENTVVRIFQKGYALRNRLLRPAQVVVSVVPQSEEGSAEGQSAD